MSTTLDIANDALQLAGTRTNISQTEFTNKTSNEAIQIQLIINKLRNQLNRMAPWDCTKKWANLTYITSVPTTPENNSGNPPFWQPGTPAPPWAYEYQYPVDCMRARYIVPQYTAQAGGVPIFPPGTATGANQVGWTGPALKFAVATDSFYNVNAATVAAGGSNYKVNDLITLAQPTFTFTQNLTPPGLVTPQSFTMSVGAPALLKVATLTGSAIATVTVVNQIFNENQSPAGGTTADLSGSYYQPQTNPVAQGFATGPNGETALGTGATFNLTFTTAPAPQRVVLCNQEDAILCYNCEVSDPNAMDPLFVNAWTHILAARVCFQLTGNVALSNELIRITNDTIMEARKADGNEGITVNDVTPDFLRVRGNWGGPNWEYSPNMSFDWGSFYSPY